MKYLNNKKTKRNFPNGMWWRKGIMFPFGKRKYLQLGIFGHIFMFQWGAYN